MNSNSPMPSILKRRKSVADSAFSENPDSLPRSRSSQSNVAITITNEISQSDQRVSSTRPSEDPGDGKGSFHHHHKKIKKVHFEDLLKPPDPYFNVEVGSLCDTYFRGQKVRFKEKKAEHFASVVDLDAYEYHKVVFHTFLNEILQSVFFRAVIVLLVMLNACMIGVQTFPNMADDEELSLAFETIDQIIVSIFIFEIILKWVYDFRLFWKVGWNILDFVIVMCVLFASLLPLGNTNGRALVTIRVVRAFRSLRSVSSMASLSIVSHTIVKSGKDMLNIIIVLIIFMFVMSVMGVILFDYDEIKLKDFIDGSDAWYVSFICVTCDGWADLIQKYMKVEGPGDTERGYSVLLMIYLMIGISAGGFVFANLIVAVIVTNLELAVKEFRDERALSDNPLEFHAHQAPVIDILPVHELLAANNTALISQRPFKIPTLKKFSIRRLQAYIGLIVALEHNMLEAEIIHIDLEKIMAVVVSTMRQLDVFKTQQQLEVEKQEALDDLSMFTNTMGLIPTDKVTQIEALENLQKMKHQKEAYGKRSSVQGQGQRESGGWRPKSFSRAPTPR